MRDKCPVLNKADPRDIGLWRLLVVEEPRQGNRRIKNKVAQ